MLKYFITGTSETTVLQLLTENLPAKYDPAVIIESGGVWLQNGPRVVDPGHRLKKGDTFRIYISSFQGCEYDLDSDDVVFEDRDLLVVYKPGNLNVHAVPSPFGSVRLQPWGLTVSFTTETRRSVWFEFDGEGTSVSRSG